MTKRIENAINVFLDAINNGTLAKGTCVACAVGNLVAHGMDAKIESKLTEDGIDFECEKENGIWAVLFRTNRHGKQEIDNFFIDDDDVLGNINATKFTWQELAIIENVFETNAKINFMQYINHTQTEIKQDQIKGLEAVIKVMMEFDNDQFDIQEQFTSKVKMVTA